MKRNSRTQKSAVEKAIASIRVKADGTVEHIIPMFYTRRDNLRFAAAVERAVRQANK